MNLSIKTFFILWISHFFMDFCLGIWPIYKTLAAIDLAQAGLISTISGFTGECLQIFFGYFSDQGHRKKILVFGLLLASCIFIITFAFNFYSLLALMLLLMVGSGAFHPAAVGAASKFFKEYKGRAILLFTSGGAIGFGCSQITFSFLTNWSNGHIFFLYLPFTLLLLTIFFHPFPESSKSNKPFQFKALFTPLHKQRHPLLLLYFIQALSTGVYVTFVFVLPDLLQLKNSSQWLFLGGGHLFFVFGSAIATVCISVICHKWGFKISLGVSLAFAFVFILSFLLLPISSTLFHVILLTLLGSVLYVTNPIIVAWGNHLVPENPSTVSAFLMGMAWCISHLFPAITGFLKNFFFVNTLLNLMVLISLLLLISLTLTFMIPSKSSEILDKKVA